MERTLISLQLLVRHSQYQESEGRGGRMGWDTDFWAHFYLRRRNKAESFPAILECTDGHPIHSNRWNMQMHISPDWNISNK